MVCERSGTFRYKAMRWNRLSERDADTKDSVMKIAVTFLEF